ncbi:hypothetical protein INS49_014888 [Diaporthe citri]|uniref:uncharacterized protein n=1 Tax=Diaporthe citri TaxID=83186 RepID=UPI001C80F4D8|nr:uncharacterized protein INS49_014888 [Diaporthe citri]KAG6357012.1 hypothetical protein INS49_014888 [Diaporthe citri]
MDTEEIKDTIVVAWPPQPKVDEDKAAESKTSRDSINVATTGTSTAAPRPARQAEEAPARACGFCRQFLRGDGPCSHVRGTRQSAQPSR